MATTHTSSSSSSVAAQAPSAFTFGKVLALVWHTAALAVLTYGLRRLPVHADISGFNVEEQFGSHYQFLTVLGMWFSRLSTLFAISADVTPGSHMLVHVKTLLSAIAMPAEILISMLYWPILFTNPSLLIPPRKIADPTDPTQFIMKEIRLPILDDLAFHAAPAIFLLIDYMAFSPPFPAHLHPSLLSALSTGAYGAWVEFCASKNGTYPYPLLGLLSNAQRFALYAGCAAVFVGITLATTAAHKAFDKAFDRKWDSVEDVQTKGTTAPVDARAAAVSKSKKKK